MAEAADYDLASRVDGCFGGSRVQIRERRGTAQQNVVGIRVGRMQAGHLLWCWESGVGTCVRCSTGWAKQQYRRRQCSETYSPLPAQAVGRRQRGTCFEAVQLAAN